MVTTHAATSSQTNSANQDQEPVELMIMPIEKHAKVSLIPTERTRVPELAVPQHEESNNDDGQQNKAHTISTFDGVFSNLSAKPEPYENPGDYENRINVQFSGNLVELRDFDDVVVEGLEVVSIFFEWIGFLLAYALSQSHAAKYGSLVGLGITIALQSAIISDYSNGPDFLQKHPDLSQLLGFLLAFSGYVLMLYGFYSYQKLRELAKDQIASQSF